MGLAQRLYEGVTLGKEGPIGLITYMRTDSTRVSDDALREAREFIGQRFGKEYLPETPNLYQEQEGRSGRPRSRPAHVGGSHPGSG